MDAARPEEILTAMRDGWKMRAGRKLGRTLYLHPPRDEAADGTGVCVGIVDSEDLAAAIIWLWNKS